MGLAAKGKRKPVLAGGARELEATVEPAHAWDRWTYPQESGASVPKEGEGDDR
jgi:hypothetical protein